MISNVPLQFRERNDETVFLTFTTPGSPDATPLDLTGATVEFVMKATASVDDTAGTVLSSTGGTPAVTITDALAGEATVEVAASLLTAPASNQFWRADVLRAGKRKTAITGTYSVTDL